MQAAEGEPPKKKVGVDGGNAPQAEPHIVPVPATLPTAQETEPQPPEPTPIARSVKTNTTQPTRRTHSVVTRSQTAAMLGENSIHVYGTTPLPIYLMDPFQTEHTPLPLHTILDTIKAMPHSAEWRSQTEAHPQNLDELVVRSTIRRTGKSWFNASWVSEGQLFGRIQNCGTVEKLTITETKPRYLGSLPSDRLAPILTSHGVIDIEATSGYLGSYFGVSGNQLLQPTQYTTFSSIVTENVTFFAKGLFLLLQSLRDSSCNRPYQGNWAKPPQLEIVDLSAPNAYTANINLIVASLTDGRLVLRWDKPGEAGTAILPFLYALAAGGNLPHDNDADRAHSFASDYISWPSNRILIFANQALPQHVAATNFDVNYCLDWMSTIARRYLCTSGLLKAVHLAVNFYWSTFLYSSRYDPPPNAPPSQAQAQQGFNWKEVFAPPPQHKYKMVFIDNVTKNLPNEGCDDIRAEINNFMQIIFDVLQATNPEECDEVVNDFNEGDYACRMFMQTLDNFYENVLQLKPPEQVVAQVPRSALICPASLDATTLFGSQKTSWFSWFFVHCIPITLKQMDPIGLAEIKWLIGLSPRDLLTTTAVYSAILSTCFSTVLGANCFTRTDMVRSTRMGEYFQAVNYNNFFVRMCRPSAEPGCYNGIWCNVATLLYHCLGNTFPVSLTQNVRWHAYNHNGRIFQDDTYYMVDYPWEVYTKIPFMSISCFLLNLPIEWGYSTSNVQISINRELIRANHPVQRAGWYPLIGDYHSHINKVQKGQLAPWAYSPYAQAVINAIVGYYANERHVPRFKCQRFSEESHKIPDLTWNLADPPHAWELHDADVINRRIYPPFLFLNYSYQTNTWIYPVITDQDNPSPYRICIFNHLDGRTLEGTALAVDTASENASLINSSLMQTWALGIPSGPPEGAIARQTSIAIMGDLQESGGKLPEKAAPSDKYFARRFYADYSVLRARWELRRPGLVLAPMVDASELAWRLLARRHGATLAFSPMFHAANFLRDQRYRREALQTCPEDRPLIIQFCGNNADTILGAALLAQDHCDGIDLNLGCPQAIAKRGNYGAFLQDDWPLLQEIVSKMSRELSVPVSCKVRVFESVSKSVEYAKMLEAAGCSLLTVHGRTREQKGPLTGLASWEHVKAVKESVSIPVIGNGNVQCLEDAKRFLAETGVDGVMSAEGHLTNPYLFSGICPPAWEPALEYLELVTLYPAPNSFIRGHLFKLLHKLFTITENADIREEIAKGSSMEDFKNALLKLKEKYEPYHEGKLLYEETKEGYDLNFPPWICQPYVRIPPEEHIQKMAQKAKEAQEKENCQVGEKRVAESESGEVLSKKKMKKMARKTSSKPYARREVLICKLCPNPLGGKCSYSLCKRCCRQKCYEEEADCPGHGILVKTRREKARSFGKPDPHAKSCSEDNTVQCSVPRIYVTDQS